MRNAAKKRWSSVGLIAAGFWAALALGAFAQAHAQQPAPAQQQPVVDELVLNDTIQPVSADEVTRALDRANSDGAQALLIEIDTPG